VIGFVIPEQINSQILNDSNNLYLTALGVTNFSEWQDIPGARNLTKTHTINYFNVTDLTNGTPSVVITQNVTMSETM